MHCGSRGVQLGDLLLDLGNQAASRRAVRRLQAHGKMLAAEHLGKRARGTAPPIVDGLAAKDVESHCSDTLCSSDVSQRCAAAPQPGRFRQQFQGNWDLWLGREGSNLRMAESKSAALPLGYAPTGDPGSVEELATADSLRSQPVYRVRRGISTAWRRKIPQLPGPGAPHSIIRPGEDPFRAGAVRRPGS